MGELRGKSPFIIDIEKRLDTTGLIHLDEESFSVTGQETGLAEVTGKEIAKIKEQPSSGR
jgi:hypothetical protein